MCFPPVAVALQRMARFVTKWSAECDRRMTRMFQYIKHSLDLVLTGEVDSALADQAVIACFPDADLAGDYMCAKSSSGEFIGLQTGSHMWPLTWGIQKQGSSAQHTQEAETVSMASCLRADLIPIQKLFSVALGRPIRATVGEDNSASIIAVVKGYSPSLRHLQRTQRTSLSFCHEVVEHPDKPALSDSEDEHDKACGVIDLIKVDTNDQLGDFFTKTFARSDFDSKLRGIGMRNTAELTDKKATYL
jgi:hypothetical protein